MHTMTLGFGPTMQDGASLGPGGTASLPSASSTYNLMYDSFAITYSGATIVGSSNTFYTGVDGIVTTGNTTLTWIGKPTFLGVTEIDVTFGETVLTPTAGTLSGSVGSTALSWGVSNPGTISQTIGTPTPGVITLGPTPPGWQITSIVIKYTTQYPDNSTA